MINYPITPPPELVQQWYDNMGPDPGPFESFAIAAARWGADVELEACCEWLRNDGLFETRIGHLRTARRPKPPSLKEQALNALKSIERGQDRPEDTETIRRALEALPE